MNSNTYSIFFDNYNTFEDFHLFPTERPYIAPPEPYTKFEEVTGMNGVLDYTNVLVNKPIYKDREGSWEFQFIPYEKYSWYDLKQDLYKKIHGKWFDRIAINEDQNHFYRGRLSVDSFDDSSDGLKVTIKYRVDPKRYNKGERVDADTIKTTKYETWNWNDLLETNDILYGKFTVQESKARTLINKLNRSVNVDAYCSGSFRVVEDNDSEYHLLFGQNTNAFTLKPGSTQFIFYGTGDIQLDYPME